MISMKYVDLKSKEIRKILKLTNTSDSLLPALVLQYTASHVLEPVFFILYIKKTYILCLWALTELGWEPRSFGYIIINNDEQGEGRGFGKNEGEWIWKVTIRTKKKFQEMGEA